MAYKRKTWTEKLHATVEPHVVRADKDFAGVPAGSSMLIPTPLIVDAYIRSIPKGSGTTLQQMRKDLAADYHAEYCCPVTSGIFLRIAAEAAYESYMQGTPLKNITPFWRIIDSRSPTIKKLTFGQDFVLEQRKAEKLPI